MLAPTVLAARATAVLTGSGTADYCADLDMTLTEDGWVTVEVTGTKGSLDSIALSMHCGPAATPTMSMSNGMGAMTETISGATWTRAVTVQCKSRYFRACVTGAGATPTSSDAVVNYRYTPKANARSIGLVDGVMKLSS